jgi:Fe-S cluster biogenesis protein NfuA
VTPKPATPAAGKAADDVLRHHGERIERLMEEVRAMAGPSTWPRVEELVRLLVELYGAGLERLLAHARAVATDDAALAERLRADELVASLLLLHGLHPTPTRERVERAVERARLQLGAAVVTLELGGLDEDGVVRVRLAAAQTGCPSSRGGLARAVEEAVIEAAPEVRRVVVEDPAAPPAPGRLVQIGPPRPHPVPG